MSTTAIDEAKLAAVGPSWRKVGMVVAMAADRQGLALQDGEGGSVSSQSALRLLFTKAAWWRKVNSNCGDIARFGYHERYGNLGTD
jgi:hypothetical protein